MKLSTLDLKKLLPEFMREDESAIALADGLTEALKPAVYALPQLSIWNNIDNLSEEMLDQLAEELNIAWYDKTATLSTKKEVVRSSDIIHSKLGTKYAVERVISELFGEGYIDEWFDYGGEPYHFKVYSSNPTLVGENYNKFLETLNAVKRQSAILDSIVISLTGRNPIYIGFLTSDIKKHSFTMYNLDSLTASEYDSMHLSAENYDKLNLTSEQYKFTFKEQKERGMI